MSRKSRSYFGSLDDPEETKGLLERNEAQREPRTQGSSSLRQFGRGALIFASVLCMLAVSTIVFQSKSSSSKQRVAQDKSLDDRVTVKTSTSTKMPNILFLLIDDLGYGSLGNSDSDIAAASPYLSSLAKSGVMLTNYYTQEICSPSRAALMTGRYPITLGMQYGEIGTGSSWALNITEVLLPEILKEAGYKNYILGKWNLGHYTSEFLPTARGFDQYIGYLSGREFYWSKIQPDKGKYVDFIHANSTCYESYTKSDLEMYSTHFYRDRALDVIRSHDFADPMFLYFASQAVHDPFDDNSTFVNGMPGSYVGEGLHQYFLENLAGTNRVEYAMSLKVLDDVMSDIVKALKERGQWDNTILIVASDNGGCYESGGRNGDLRGTKGSLFEGGVKVDSFVYSERMPETLKGSTFDGLMHVSDWFPTIMDLVGIDYVPETVNAFDGVSQYSAMFESAASPRDHLLYNLYLNVKKTTFTWGEDAVFGIRKGDMKLLYTYTGNEQSTWHNFSNALADDDNLDSYSCPQSFALIGTYTKMLFNLTEDPNETTNLYDDPLYETEQNELIELVYTYTEKVAYDLSPERSESASIAYWESHDGYIMPWNDPMYSSSTVNYCEPTTFFTVTTGWESYTMGRLD